MESEEILRGGGVVMVFNRDITDPVRTSPKLQSDFVVSYRMAMGRRILE